MQCHAKSQNQQVVQIAKQLVQLQLAALIAAAMIVFTTERSHAATFTPNITTDTVDTVPGDGVCADALGDCSLRAAVMEANALPGNDRIDLEEATYTLSIFNDAGSCGEGLPTNDVAYVDHCSDLDVTDHLVVQGVGLYRSLISAVGIAAGGNSGHFDLAANTTLSLNDLGLVSASQVGAGGAVRSRGGGLLVHRCWFFFNRASFGGGAIDTQGGSTDIAESYFRSNETLAGASGGAISHRGPDTPSILPSMLIRDSSFQLNHAAAGTPPGGLPDIADGAGGAIALSNNANVVLDQVTLHNNRAQGRGGGLFVFSSANSVTVRGSTITENQADSDFDATDDPGGGGGGLFVVGGASRPTINLNNTILANNIDSDPVSTFGTPDCEGTLDVFHNSLISVDVPECVRLSSSNSFVDTDPMMGDFGDQGGWVPTAALLPSSPLVNQGNPALCWPQDARGRDRIGTCDVGAFESGHAPSFLPKVSLDGNDVTDDSTCGARIALPGFPLQVTVCTLRAAVQTANTIGSAQASIELEAETYELTLPGSDDGAANGDLDVTMPGTLTVHGVGARTTSITSTVHRLFDVDPTNDGARLELEALTLHGGSTTEAEGGGNVLVQGSGILSAIDVAFTHGVADEGGAIATRGSASASVLRSTLHNNLSRDGGAQGGEGDGGAVLQGSSGNTTIDTSTFSQNRAERSGGAVALLDGSVILRQTTITENTADEDNDGDGDGGGIWGFDENLNIADSVLAANSDRGGEAPDCAGEIDSSGYNFVGIDAGCGFSAASSDVVGSAGSPLDPQLEVFGNWGGSTDTYLPLAGSPLVDASDPAGCSGTDQRGVPRPMDGDANGTARCDQGAVERAELSLFSDGFESGNLSAWSASTP